MNIKQNLISRINGIDIVTVERDGEIFVPIKPICTALGVSYPAQLEKLKADETFTDSTVPLGGIVAADGKEREMVCLPLWLVYLWLVYLWLGTISPNNVAEPVRKKVIEYRLECAKALYDHFTGSMARTLETNRAEIELLQEINAAIGEEKEAKVRRRKAEGALEKLRADRLNPQPRLL